MAVKRQLVVGVASVAALYAGLSNALGLGEVELQSALNQPLNAVIQLQGSAGVSPDDIRVSLAGADAFANAGMERPFFLSDLRFVPVVQGGQLHVRIESSKPVLEPYLNFLVELRQPNGRVLREYTLLLDPPMYDADAGSPSQTPARASTPALARRTANTSSTTSNRPTTAERQPQLPDISAQSNADTYNTVAGDTLWDIAAKTRPADSVSIRDNMLAIRALNPQAFIGGDIGRLRSDARLALPTAEQLGVEAPETAVSAASNAPDTPAQAVRPGQAAPERVAQASDLAATSASESGARSATPGGDNNARLRIEETTPDTASADNQLLLQRLQSLEARFNVLLNELDDRDRQIANLQAELEVLRAAQAAEAPGTQDTTAPVGTVGENLETTGAASATGSDDPESGAIAAEVTLPEPQASNETLLSRWWPALLGLLAALLAALLWKRRHDEQASDTTTVDGHELTVPEAAAATLAAEAAVQTTMVREAVAPRNTRPVDQLDGVELYITYGRFAEARVMLERAIEENPKRLDLRYQQLRVLAELGDVRKFTEQEQTILALGGDSSRIGEIKSRYPQVLSARNDQVEQVDDIEPLLDEDLEAISAHEESSEWAESAIKDESSELNLNDFTLDPDWDLIEGLTPAPAGYRDSEDRDAVDSEAADAAEDEMLRDGLRQLPEVEELEHDDNLFPDKPDARKLPYKG
ncbi:type IV pilus assembly protein FimV [Pseudomonas saliphila]|uniref:type IV pilus assembly protein FimV n=1 Tax=Pseudomonas saliphila TaxID=2586906 RepID=UPI00123B29F1|nr:FimV/HubP family polar landmark protein [Pseudomonas saliphila]